MNKKNENHWSAVNGTSGTSTEAKSNPPGLNGGASNAEVFAQAAMAKLYGWMGSH